MERKPKKLWTDQEDLYLKENYSIHTYHEIGEHLNRTLGSVCMRVDKLGLHKTKIKEDYPNRIGIIVRPSPGILIHYGIYSDDYLDHHKKEPS